jgi:hypothetical protein
MLLQVDVESLIKNRVSADQFLVTQLINDKNYDLLNQYLGLYSSDEIKSLFLNLVKVGLVDNYNNIDQYDVTKLTVRPSFMKVLAQGDFFNEFLQVYPASVVRPDGVKDYLRTDLNRARKSYSKITGNKLIIHQSILEALRFEILLRKKENNLAYMKKLPKWLASEEWKIYEQRIKDEGFESLVACNQEGDLGYGNNLE